MLNDSRYEAGDWFRQNAVAGDRVTYTDGAYKLPRLEHGILTLPVPPASEAMSALERYQAEFITVIPVLRLEVEHEYFLPDEAYRRLVDGSAGYVQVLGVQSPSPLGKRLITFVNPPVKVFARKELLSRVSPQGIKVETDR
jgi:hypothetical protein